jgi:hypothetical protein
MEEQGERRHFHVGFTETWQQEPIQVSVSRRRQHGLVESDRAAVGLTLAGADSTYRRQVALQPAGASLTRPGVEGSAVGWVFAL